MGQMAERAVDTTTWANIDFDEDPLVVIDILQYFHGTFGAVDRHVVIARWQARKRLNDAVGHRIALCFANFHRD